MINPAKLQSRLTNVLKNTKPLEMVGRITKVIGLVLESEGPKAAIGEVCSIRDRAGNELSKAEIVGFKDERILSMVLGDLTNISPGMQIVATGSPLTINCGDFLLGRIIDGLGNAIDGGEEFSKSHRRSIYASPPNPLFRQRITEPVSTGIRAIDTMLTLGMGQRIGIFAGSGVGKSTLLGMIARNTSADINVIALIGERGREVREFIENDLGEEGLRRSIVVVATSDQPSLVRVKSALVATTIAEYFRDKGKNVMLMMDSSTRFAMAQREVGLTIGEPPTTKGYTPSVFSAMQKMMERAGTGEVGSITGLYTILVEGDDMNEPIADTARGILDGHVVLSRKMASLGHYPAIDVLESISRVAKDVITREHNQKRVQVNELLATYRSAEDLINIGAYQKGINPKIDTAVAYNEKINNFLKQYVEEKVSLDDSVKELMGLIG